MCRDCLQPPFSTLWAPLRLPPSLLSIWYFPGARFPDLVSFSPPRLARRCMAAHLWRRGDKGYGSKDGSRHCTHTLEVLRASPVPCSAAKAALGHTLLARAVACSVVFYSQRAGGGGGEERDRERDCVSSGCTSVRSCVSPLLYGAPIHPPRQNAFEHSHARTGAAQFPKVLSTQHLKLHLYQVHAG